MGDIIIGKFEKPEVADEGGLFEGEFFTFDQLTYYAVVEKCANGDYIVRKCDEYGDFVDGD